MDIKLYDSEIKIMELIWENEPVKATALSRLAASSFGWNKNTTYTVIKKLVEKNAVLRGEPGFICSSLIKKEQVQKNEANSLIEKLYGGSRRAFFASFANEKLTDEEIAALKSLIDRKG